MVVTFCVLLALVIAPATSNQVAHAGPCVKPETPTKQDPCVKWEYITVKSCPEDITTSPDTPVVWTTPLALSFRVPKRPEPVSLESEPDIQSGATFTETTHLTYKWRDDDGWPASCSFTVTVA